MEELIKKVEKEIRPQFDENEEIEKINSEKVLNAFKKEKISEAHLHGTTGYGYGDIGREAAERI